MTIILVNHEDGEYSYVVSTTNQNRVMDDSNMLVVREEVNIEGCLR